MWISFIFHDILSISRMKLFRRNVNGSIGRLFESAKAVRLICDYVSFLGCVVLKRYQDFFVGLIADVVLTHAPPISGHSRAHAGRRGREHERCGRIQAGLPALVVIVRVGCTCLGSPVWFPGENSFDRGL
jgi:hypothetical protein